MWSGSRAARVVLGGFGYFDTLLVAIPEPVLSGATTVLFGLIFAGGLEVLGRVRCVFVMCFGWREDRGHAADADSGSTEGPAEAAEPVRAGTTGPVHEPGGGL